MPGHDYLSALPDVWQRSLCRYRIEPIERGMSAAGVFRLQSREGDEMYLKIMEGNQSAELRNEVARTEWLGKRGIRVPRFVRAFDDETIAAALMTALPGRHPREVQRPLPDLMSDLADGLLALHSLPAVDCPFDETVTARLATAREMISRGLIDAEHFAERNQGLDPETIYRQLQRTLPDGEDPAVVHGDATFDNLLIDDDGRVGFLDCGRAGRGDRYLDLSTILTDIEEYFGPDGAQLFSTSYGPTPLDHEKLAFFGDLYELF
jgi:aminoglycoside 3'-phosphotransferase II